MTAPAMRSSVSRRIALALLVFLGLAPWGAPAQAQAPGRELDRTLNRIASAWSRGDAGGVLAHASGDGVTLELEGDVMGPLPARQAAAALRQVLAGRETLSVRPGMTRIVGDRAPRAFGELSWTSRAEGTTERETRTVFLAFTQEGGAWRLTQVRLLRD